MTDSDLSVIFVVVTTLIIIFAPNVFNHEVFTPYREFIINNPWVGPVFLFFMLIGWPLSIVYWEHRQSGVPFRIVLQSFLEYVFGDDLTRRLSTIKLVITEKELEENK